MAGIPSRARKRELCRAQERFWRGARRRRRWGGGGRNAPGWRRLVRGGSPLRTEPESGAGSVLRAHRACASKSPERRVDWVACKQTWKAALSSLVSASRAGLCSLLREPSPGLSTGFSLRSSNRLWTFKCAPRSWAFGWCQRQQRSGAVSQFECGSSRRRFVFSLASLLFPPSRTCGWGKGRPWFVTLGRAGFGHFWPLSASHRPVPLRCGHWDTISLNSDVSTGDFQSFPPGLPLFLELPLQCRDPGLSFFF